MSALARFSRNVKTALAEPEIIPQYLRWLIMHPFTGGPSVWCTPRYRMATWTDFSDFFWARRLSLLDEGDKNLMSQQIRAAGAKRTVAIDVGANLGLFSLSMVEAGFSEIHAFEPDPTTFTRLVRNIGLNGLSGKIHLNCMAVGQTYSLARFSVAGGAGTHHVETGGSASNGQAIHVATIALDDYCIQNGIETVDFLKIDVEGFEPWVIRGMSKLLAERRIKMFIIEISPGNLRQAGTSAKELFDVVKTAGYEFREILESGQPGKLYAVADLEAVEQTKFGFMNAVCVPIT